MSLCIQKTNLRISAGLAKQFPRDPMPQVAFSGRSNVGKSSLINTLLNRKGLARVSSAPGKTITINFYDVDKKLFLVDMPGYGYAKRSPQEKQQRSDLTDGYFRKNPNRDLLKLVIQLIDCKTGPTDDDLLMLNWLNANNVPYLIVATKIDKLNKTELKNQLDELCRSKFLNPETVIVPFSSHTGEGKDILWNEIATATGIKL
jgi:GTP-binding protein